MHGALFAALTLEPVLPPIDFDLHLPPAAEFGLVDVPQRPAPAPAAAEHERPEGGRDPEPIETRETPSAAPSRPSAGRVEAKRAQPVSFTAYAPKGTLLALRLHIGLLRETSLAPEVRALLASVPDWQAILGGSELDPLRDLERLYLASPDLRRSKLVIAGEYVGGETLPREAAARLARSRGAAARWRTTHGIPVARWANADDTERVVALIGKNRFVITRRDDLSRVLGVAAAQAGQTSSGAALLGLEPGLLLTLEVDGVRGFVRGNSRGVPKRLRVTVEPKRAGELHVRLDGQFEDESSAARAKDYWIAQRDRYSANPLVAFTGMRPIFAGAAVEVAQHHVTINTVVQPQQARVVLGLIRGAVAPPVAAPAMPLPAAADPP